MKLAKFTIDDINPEYIVIGDLDTDWNFELMNSTFKMVMNGSRILALHKGHYFQTDSGLQIDSGAFIKAIEYAPSTESIVVGKPTMEFFNLALKDIKFKRETTQPIKNKTGGSTFKNPENNKAWKLIKNSGCAGMCIGDARISEKHCNFFINKGNAKSEDLENLIYQVRRKVLDKTGINLELELQIIGEKL